MTSILLNWCVSCLCLVENEHISAVLPRSSFITLQSFTVRFPFFPFIVTDTTTTPTATTRFLFFLVFLFISSPCVSSSSSSFFFFFFVLALCPLPLLSCFLFCFFCRCFCLKKQTNYASTFDKSLDLCVLLCRHYGIDPSLYFLPSRWSLVFLFIWGENCYWVMQITGIQYAD